MKSLLAIALMGLAIFAAHRTVEAFDQAAANFQTEMETINAQHP